MSRAQRPWVVRVSDGWCVQTVYGIAPASRTIAAAAVAGENGLSLSPELACSAAIAREAPGERYAGGQLRIDAALGGKEMDLTAVRRVQDGQEIGYGIFGADYGEDVDHHLSSLRRVLAESCRPRVGIS